MTGPTRTCLGCGATGPRQALVRFIVADGGSVVLDERHGGHGGRGAWLHPAEACLSQALRRRAFARAFRRGDLAWDGDALRQDLTVVVGRD